jgi:hypothetical protein
LDAEVEGSEKELEDYPRPQAVVAASVLYVSSPYPTKLHVYNAFISSCSYSQNKVHKSVVLFMMQTCTLAITSTFFLAA